MNTEPTQAMSAAELADIKRRADISDNVAYMVDDDTMADLRRLLEEVDRLRAENTALREARDGVCSRCRFPMWSHDLWKCIPWDIGKYVGDDELRREVVLRELNQGALAGMSSEVTDQAADLVLAALNRYDAWRAEPDPRALGLDQDGEGQANAR